MNGRVMWAIFKRDFLSYFGNPTGYVFIVMFVLATAVFAFFPDAFFTNNRANLELLSQSFPYLLLFFVPAVAMASWAEERKQGTADLLFTLPARDLEIVLAKFASCAGIFTVSLLFTLSHAAVLFTLGSPDLGLLFANYLGYWLLGLGLLSVAMVASALTRNLTVAFIVGTIFCGVVVLWDRLAGFLPSIFGPQAENAAEALAELGAVHRLESFASGVLALEDLLYFVALIACGLYANMLLCLRRQWVGSSPTVHAWIRLTALVVACCSAVVLLDRESVRKDVTAEQLLKLQPETLEVFSTLRTQEGLPPVYIQAWISPEVPGEYVRVRDGLVRMLEEFDAQGGDQVQVVVYETEPFSDEAQRARETFGIEPKTVRVLEDGQLRTEDVFMGLAFSCGRRELTIPFFDKGLPVQYELLRSVGSVARVQRFKVGILTTQVQMFSQPGLGREQPDWLVVQDLRKQYDVEEVSADRDVPDDLDVLVVPLPSSLTQAQLNRVIDYLFAGGKALILSDPFVGGREQLSPAYQLHDGAQMSNPQATKPDMDAFYTALGFEGWDYRSVVWDAANPHRGPESRQWPKEFVFVTPREEDGPELSGFNEDHPTTAGMQEVLFIFPGELKLPEPGAQDNVEITPLLRTTLESGARSWWDYFEGYAYDRTRGGLRRALPHERVERLQSVDMDRLRYVGDDTQRVVAAAVEGKLRKPAATEGGEQPLSDETFEAIVVADLDWIGDQFFQLRERGLEELDFDNVSLLGNFIDSLAGEDSYVALRKLRQRHRSLEVIEEYEDALERERERAEEEAEENQEKAIQAAERKREELIEELQARTDLSFEAKQLQFSVLQQREARRLRATRQRLVNEAREAVEQAETKMRRRIKAKRDQVKLWAVLAPPLPALLLGLVVFVVRRVREAEGTPERRRRTQS